jgi:hypothetical protein
MGADIFVGARGAQGKISWGEVRLGGQENFTYNVDVSGKGHSQYARIFHLDRALHHSGGVASI